MQLDSAQSKTAHVIHCIEEQIRSGLLPRGSVLRSTRLLAADFNVSSQVIRYACDELERKGLIWRKPRSGTIVRGMSKLLIVRQENENNVSRTIVQSELYALARSSFLEIDMIPVEYLRSANRRKILAALKKEHYEGAVLFCSGYVGGEPELELLAALNIPVCHPVSSRDESAVTGFKTFLLDMETGLRLAGEELKKKKKKHILMAVNREKDSILFCRVWNGCGITPEKTAVIPASLSDRDLEESLSGLFSRNRFDAVACHSGRIASAIYKYCAANAISIPEDLAVINFGWAGAGKFLSPRLTEINYQLKETAKAVMEWIQHGEYTLPEVTVIHGESV